VSGDHNALNVAVDELVVDAVKLTRQTGLGGRLLPLMRAALRRFVPPTLRSHVRAVIDKRALSRLPTATVDGHHLLSALDLSDLLINPAADAAWQRSAPELGALQLPDETGGMTSGECRLLYYLTAFLKPSSVLEIGTHIGASTVHFAAALRDHTNNGTLTTVDIVDVNAEHGPWRTLGAAKPSDLVRTIGMGDRVRFVVAPALDLLAAEKRFDLILLDGDHAADAVYREVPAALRCINPGGVIVLHDYFPDLKPIFRDPPLPGPFLALSHLRKQHPSLAVQTFAPLPWPTKHGTHRTCLALVVRSSTAS
jgi:predicted O-methyltransferase YrrM